MSAHDISWIVYGAGTALGLVYVGATGAKWIYSVDSGAPQPFGPAWLAFFWPLAAPVVIGGLIRRCVERRRLAAEEKRKWLDAPLP